MPNYFFRVIRDGEMLPDDDELTEYTDLEAARSHAVEGARGILTQAVLSGTAADLNVQIEVQDERGAPLLSVNAGRVVDADT